MRRDSLTVQRRKTPIQARSAKTVDAIFEACIQVLLQVGIERLTTTRVAERAGVSVGTLYQYFPNKQALLLALLERHLAHTLAAVVAACEQAKGQPLGAMAESLIGAFIDAKMERPDVSLALYPVTLDANGSAALTRVTQQAQLTICDLLASAKGARFASLQMASFILATAPVGPVMAVLGAGAAPALVEAVRTELVTLAAAYLERAATLKP